MDSALKLKIAFDKGEVTSFDEAKPFLEQSSVMKLLLQKGDFDTLALMNRLIQLAEIPFVNHLPQVKLWLDELVERSFFGQGFSYSGTPNEMLACYNGMITSVLVKLAFRDKQKIEQGIHWILEYQNMSRGQVNKWQGESILKYGGCMKQTPCYIGLVKSTIALSDYVHSTNYTPNKTIESKLSAGLEYILNQQLFLRQSSNKPITTYINKLTYPFSYKSNVIELLRLMADNGCLNDMRCKAAKELIQKKRKKNGVWQANYLVQPKHWINFDATKEPALWLMFQIKKLGLG